MLIKMDIRRSVLLGVLLFQIGCSPEIETDQASSQEAPAETADPVAVASVAPDIAPDLAPTQPDPVQVAAPVPPKPKRVVPENTFYLVKAVSFETDAGIMGFKPGTEVVRQPDGSYLSGGHKLTLALDQVTKDLSLAENLAAADQKAQAEMRRAAPASAKAPRPAQPLPPVVARSKDESAPDVIRASEKEPLKPLGSGSSLSQPGALGKTHSSTKDKTYVDHQGRTYWKDIYGRRRYD